MNASRRAGFTLIELLTVIAIIAILAGMVFTVGPRMIERAKMRRMEGALLQVNTALVAYMTDNKGCYPPAYGYVAFKQANNPVPTDTSQEEVYYHLRPYMVLLKNHGDVKLYDEWSESYDTNRDGRLSLLEFMPAGKKNPLGNYDFVAGLPRYMGEPNYVAPEWQLQMDAKQRPFVYIPVNRTQAQRAAKFWIKSGDFTANTWDPASPDLQGVSFPPAKYDAFVLISVGPGGSTYGLVDDPPFLAGANPRNAYHLAALRAYFLATRDLNANGLRDFDFNARKNEGEGKLRYTVAPTNQECTNELPCATPNLYGPVIYVSQ